MNAIFEMIFGFINFICKWFFILVSPFLASFVLWFVYYYVFKRRRFQKGSYKPFKKPSFFKRIFWQLPRQFWLDKFNADPDFFKDYGVHIIAGEQGSGKTITLTYLLSKYRKMYPKIQVRTNYGYTYEDGTIDDWRDITGTNNGIYGQIDVLDEIQTWFNSLQSKDFPPEMLTEITQQRKQRKIIFGTSQVFTRVAKPIREQTTFLYEPKTILGCLTIVPVYRPSISADGLADKKRLLKCFFFVHDDVLRESFDTYKKIEMLSKSGFKPEERQIRNSAPIVISEK